MAKKVIATLKTATGKDYAKVVRVIRSPKTGAWAFKEDIVANDMVKDFLASK